MTKPRLIYHNDTRHTYLYAFEPPITLADARGADGAYTWNLRWPPGAEERGLLTQLRDPDLLRDADKHYVFRRRAMGSEQARATSRIAEHMGYPPDLPIVIEAAGRDGQCALPFFFADDPEAAGDRLTGLVLRIKVNNLVSNDDFRVALDGKDLGDALVSRTTHCYRHQWLEYDLRKAPPAKGRNVLAFALCRRPDGLTGGVTIDDVEILAAYHGFADLQTRPPVL